MSFFKNFPKFTYDFPNGVSVKMTDIFRNARIIANMDDSEIFEFFSLTDGDRPEGVAYKYYGDPNLYWLVLMSNGIIDVNTEWPKFSGEEDRLLQNQYSGYAFYFDDVMDVRPGDFIVKRDASSNGEVSDEYGVVYSYNKSLNKIEVRNNAFSSITTGTSSLDSYFVFRETSHEKYETVSSGFLAEQDYLTPKRIDLLQDSVIYFKHINGYSLNPKTRHTVAAEENFDPSDDTRLTYDETNKLSVGNSRFSILFKYMEGTSVTNVTPVTTRSLIDSASSGNKVIRVLRRSLAELVINEIQSILTDDSQRDRVITVSGGVGGIGGGY